MLEGDQNARYGTWLKYDRSSRLVQRVGPDGATETWERGHGGEVVAYIDAAGHRTEFERNALGQIETTLRPWDLAQGHAGTRTQYDALGGVREVCDATGRITKFRHNPRGELIAQWREYEGDAADENGNRPVYQKLTFAYDENGNRIRLCENPNPESLACDPDDDDSVTLMEYGYDARNRLTEVSDAKGHTWLYDYDDVDRLTQKTDPLGHTKRIAYPYVNQQVVLPPGVQDEEDGWTTLSWPHRTVQIPPSGKARITEFDSAGKPFRFCTPSCQLEDTTEQEDHWIVRLRHDRAGRRTSTELPPREGS